MASSLDPDNFPQGSRHVSRGRLGPGDSSDSGSDMAGPDSLEEDLLLDPIEDLDTDTIGEDAEPQAEDEAGGEPDADPEENDDDLERAEHAAGSRRAWAGRKSRGRAHGVARGRRTAL